MARVRRTPRPNAELDDSWLRIALGNIAAADRLIDRLIERMATLAESPRLGRARPEIASEVRALVEGDHLILYRGDGGEVEIVRVIHGAEPAGWLRPPSIGRSARHRVFIGA